MINLEIIETGKSYNPKDTYSIFNRETKNFKDLKEAKEYLKDRYRKAKRSKMYVDTKEGKALHCGYIFGFRNEDISHVPVQKWLQQDWVSFEEVKTLSL